MNPKEYAELVRGLIEKRLDFRISGEAVEEKTRGIGGTC